MSPPTINPQVVITPIKPTDLHAYWDFLRRGLEDIRRKVKPDWLCEDAFGALRAEAAQACIVSRGPRALGFFIWHKQERPWSHKIDIFVWAGWTIPLRERLPSDNMDEVVYRSIEYLHQIKRSVAGERLTAITSRKGAIRKYRLKELFVTVEL